MLTSPNGAKEAPAAVKLDMPERCLLYYITDRTAFAADEATRRRRLLEKITEAARAGLDHIQLREKDLTTRELESLAREAMAVNREARRLITGHQPPTTALLINSRTDVALAVGADGVHLRSDDVSPTQVNAMWRKTHVRTAAIGCPATQSAGAVEAGAKLAQFTPLIGVSCHSAEEVVRAKSDGATFAVLAPIFEKKDLPTARLAGLAKLREACKADIPVLALGGITLENAKSCLEAGAAGIAAIRLFQENDVAEVVESLRRLGP
jgi:thiamine-phosphate pyrophosphorylase